MVVHPHASAFDSRATEYEQGRPGYPATILDRIGARVQLTPTTTVVDLGAGTGKLTRVLVESPARVIAIEPIAAMREEFVRILPDTELIDATAESMPLDDESVDVVMCGQSFRWFATDAALEEIARVLRPGGELVLAFNRYHNSNSVQRWMSEILRAAGSENEEKKPGANWRDVLFGNPLFALIEEFSLPNEYVVDRDGLFGRVYSSSQFVRLPAARQQELLDQLEALIDSDVVDLGQITEVTAMRRV